MFCSHCGSEIHDEAVICVKCGCEVSKAKPIAITPTETDSTMSIVVKVFMILGCISQGWLIIPLAWCIPLTVKVFNSLKSGTPITTGTKVCSLIFVNLIAGICLFCMEDGQ